MEVWLACLLHIMKRSVSDDVLDQNVKQQPVLVMTVKLMEGYPDRADLLLCTLH